jgi:hypothetical protein
MNRAPQYPRGAFRIFTKIRGDIRNFLLVASVIDTGNNDTGKDSCKDISLSTSQNEHIVEEQIDETDIRKIPQIVWAESGSLTVPV